MVSNFGLSFTSGIPWIGDPKSKVSALPLLSPVVSSMSPSQSSAWSLRESIPLQSAGNRGRCANAQPFLEPSLGGLSSGCGRWTESKQNPPRTWTESDVKHHPEKSWFFSDLQTAERLETSRDFAWSHSVPAWRIASERVAATVDVPDSLHFQPRRCQNIECQTNSLFLS